ncbi:MAG TPA: hypothetical protein VIK54_00590, partial [Acidimicrobiia bacterium]
MGPLGGRVLGRWWQWVGVARLVGQAPGRDSPRIAMIERRWVLPPFTKREGEIADCRPSYLELDVVPWRPVAVTVVEFDCLAIAGVP